MWRWPAPPYRFALLHCLAISTAMLALAEGWFISEPPYDCVYVPFMITSGPVVYSVAHFFQHQVEGWLPLGQKMLAANLIPGMICIALGCLQWTLIESVAMKMGFLVPPKSKPLFEE